MGEWSDYFEDFLEENPANQREDISGDALRARVAREATYSPSVLAQIAEGRKKREAAEILLLGMRLKDRENAQAELHRSIGGLMEAYAWFDVSLGLKIKSYSNNATAVLALLKPTIPMKLRLDCLRGLVEQTEPYAKTAHRSKWDAWIAHAETIRTLRNDYAHGRWVHDPRTSEFRFVSLSWAGESEFFEKSVATLPAQIDERSAQIWELTRSIDVVTEPFFPQLARISWGTKLSDVKP